MKTNKIQLFIPIVLGSLIALAPLTHAEDNNIPSPAKPAASADSKPAARVNMREQMEKLLTDIKATDDQKEKLKPIFKGRNEKMKALREDTAVSQEDRMAKRKEIVKETNAKVKEVLGEDQFKQYLDFQKEQNKRLQARGQKPSPDAAPKDAPKN